MKRILVSILCIFSFQFSLSFAEKGYQGVEVRSTSPELVEIKPGRIVTGSFLISNNTGREEEFIEKLILPAGWEEIISDQFPFKLAPQEERVRVVAFLVSHTSPAGDYHISYSITSQKDYNITDSDSMSVVILPSIKLEILVEDKPEVVVAGEAYEVRFRLVNKGNSSVRSMLKAKSTPTFPLEMEPSQVSLEAGEFRIIKLEVKTDEKLKQRIKNILEIKVEIEESKGGAASDRQTASVEIIPRVTGELDPYHKLPVRVALISATQNRKAGLQVECSGRGSLDERGKRRVDFLFRGPDIQDISRHGKRDEYRLSYRQKHFDLHFGDRSYSLSPLTQRFSYGRGGEANFYHKKIKSGVFYSENRWGRPKRKGFGSYFNYQFNNRFNIRGNFLSKSIRSTLSDEVYDEQIYSIQTEIEPGKAMNLDLEFGLCDSQRGNRLSELAFRIDLDGQLSKEVRYSLEKIYADPDYFGYYKDVNYTTGVITFPIYRKLRGDLSFRNYENNLDVDSTEEIANREKSYQAGIFYTFAFGPHISLKYEDLTREDITLPQNFEYQEKALKLGLTHTFGKINLSTHMEKGEFKDKVLDIRNDKLERYSIFASFRPNKKQSYNFFARMGHSSFTQNPEWTKSVGVSTRWYIRENMFFSFQYRKDNAGSERNQERDDIFTTFTYNFKNDHNLIFRGQWSKYQHQKKEFSFFLTYSIPLKIPVSKKKSIAVLEGEVYDEEKPGHPPIPEVILKANGATAITNENGEFIFPSLEPGPHYLKVEKNSIGLNRVTTEKLPILMKMEGGKTSEIKIGVVTSCKISGQVSVFVPGSDKNSNDEDTSVIFDSTASPQGMEKALYPELKQPAPYVKLLKTKEAISVSPAVSFEIKCFKGSKKRVYFSGKEIFVKSDSEGIILSEGEEEKLEEKLDRVVFIPQNESFCFSLNGKDCRGILEVIFTPKDSSLLALNRLWEEDHLKGVVPFKMEKQGKSEFEALKTQSLTASSESLFLIGPGQEEKLKKDNLRKTRGLSNTLVEITDGEEVLQELTEDEGRFSFDDIRPGKWTLKVNTADLPIHHYLEQEEFQIELKPGEEKEIMVKVLPRLRPIQIIDQGKIEEENK
jgi:hypothetical protein